MKVKNSFFINIFKCKIPTLDQFYLANIKVKSTSEKQPYIGENIVILHDTDSYLVSLLLLLQACLFQNIYCHRRLSLCWILSVFLMFCRQIWMPKGQTVSGPVHSYGFLPEKHNNTCGHASCCRHEQLLGKRPRRPLVIKMPISTTLLPICLITGFPVPPPR